MSRPKEEAGARIAEEISYAYVPQRSKKPQHERRYFR